MRHHVWTDEQLQIIRDGYEAGEPLRVIAAKTGRGKTVVQYAANKMGLKHPGGNDARRQPIAAPDADRWRNQFGGSVRPTLAYVPGIVVTGSYVMRHP